jgi:hypothetical protein
MTKIVAWSLLALAIVLGDCRSQAWAYVLFSNLGPGDTYDGTQGYSVSAIGSEAAMEVAQAMPFTPTSSASLRSIELAVQLASGTNAVNVQLLNDNGNSPGSVIETYLAVDQMVPFDMTSAGSLVKVDSLINPVLTAGTQYWVAAFPGAPDNWSIWTLSNSDVRPTAESLDGGVTWTVFPSSPVAAFRVNAVPEPASLTISSLLVVAGLAVYNRRWHINRRRWRSRQKL